MENLRNLLIVALIAISAVLYAKWIEFSDPANGDSLVSSQASGDNDSSVPNAPVISAETSIPAAASPQVNNTVPNIPDQQAADRSQLITVNTDLVVAVINTIGGVIERLEIKQELVKIDTPDQGFPLLHRSPEDTFVAEDGLFTVGGFAPNHQTQYQSANATYDLADQESVVVPLTWVAENGIEFTKTITFNRDSYVVDIAYQVKNVTNKPWPGFMYAQFNRTQPEKKGGGFGQLPSYTGGAVYEQEEHYQKIDFSDMSDENLKLETDNGWVGMLQHYFVGVWLPEAGKKVFFSTAGKQQNPQYRIGYKTEEPVVIGAGESGSLATKIYLGSKEQRRLKAVEKELNAEGLALTVDYGWLTFIGNPLFILLNWIHSIVGNWGWSIILVTVVVKLIFYPLSAASFKSMASMKKLQPRLQTLKERYKDDRQKFQMETMALYKKEKVNPVAGCLPILIQIPVFIALYWVLLESVELRHAPFALWLQDLSAKDPYYVLPVLNGFCMFLTTKLNPAPMDDIQKKVMMIMPFALVFLFASFPQGLVLYWVVNSILQIVQQWYVNRKYAS